MTFDGSLKTKEVSAKPYVPSVQPFSHNADDMYVSPQPNVPSSNVTLESGVLRPFKMRTRVWKSYLSFLRNAWPVTTTRKDTILFCRTNDTERA